MELIRKIKDAEAQAKEIVEKARVSATAQAEKGRENRRKVLEEAEQQRKAVMGNPPVRILTWGTNL